MNHQAALFSVSCERDCFEISTALRYLLHLEFERLPMTVEAAVDIKYVSPLAATGFVRAKSSLRLAMCVDTKKLSMPTSWKLLMPGAKKLCD